MKKQINFSLAVITSLSTQGFMCMCVDAAPLPEVLKKVAQTHPSILADRALKEAATHHIEVTKAPYYPTLDTQVGAGYEYTRDTFRTNQLSSGVGGVFATDRYDPSLSFRQMIFDGFTTSSQVDKSRFEDRRAGEKVHETQTNATYKTSEQYVTLRRFQRLMAFAEENIKFHESIAGKVEELVKAGKVADTDLHAVKARLDDAQNAYYDLKRQYDVATAEYISLTGEAPKDLRNAKVPEALLPQSLDEAFVLAEKNHASLQMARTNVNVTEAERESAYGAFYPQVSIEADAARRFNVGGKAGVEKSFNTLAVTRVNLYNGGRDVARTKELGARVDEARYQAESQKRATLKDVQVSWVTMQDSAKQLQELEQSVKEKKAVLDSYWQQFNLQTRSFLDILEASHEYFFAKGSLITIQAAYDQASLRLLASMGTLVQSLDNWE